MAASGAAQSITSTETKRRLGQRLSRNQQAGEGGSGDVYNQLQTDENPEEPSLDDVVNSLMPPPPNLGSAGVGVPAGQGALPMPPLDDPDNAIVPPEGYEEMKVFTGVQPGDDPNEQMHVFTGVEPGDQPLSNTNSTDPDIQVFTGVEPGDQPLSNDPDTGEGNPQPPTPAVAPTSPANPYPPSSAAVPVPSPPPHILTGPPVVNPLDNGSNGQAPTDDAGHQIPGNAELGFHEDPNWKPHDFPGHPSTTGPNNHDKNQHQNGSSSLFLSKHCASQNTWYSQLGCHILFQIQTHPLSIAVIGLALYALVVIRRRRQRQAADSARGEYRQVTARYADTAFGDDYTPAENADYLSDDDDDDDDNDAWIDDESNGGSIQMRTFGKDGLTLDEMNG